MKYLWLNVEGEMYAAPYYSDLPLIAFLHHANNKILFLKNLKYETRSLTFCKEGHSSKI